MVTAGTERMGSGIFTERTGPTGEMNVDWRNIADWKVVC